MAADYTHLHVQVSDGTAYLTLNRADKRNAVNDALLEDIQQFFEHPPRDAKVVILRGAGEHFCAGLDLASHQDREAIDVVWHSQRWHEITQRIQFGGLPVVAVMHGGVIGGGLEIASCAHVRIAERSAFYSLPEGQRGIYVGGGASVRVGRLLGADRMTEMMLTGREYDAEDGYRLGLSHYLVETGEGLALAEEMAARIASNSPLSNYAMINALPRISDMSASDGYFTESLVAGLVQTSPEARQRMEAFLTRKRTGKGE